MGKPMFKKKIYFNREKDENYELVDEAIELGFSEESANKLKYLGYEIEFEVMISEEDGELKVDILSSPKDL